MGEFSILIGCKVFTKIRPILKCPERSSPIDLILTNVPHKYTAASVFANDKLQMTDVCS